MSFIERFDCCLVVLVHTSSINGGQLSATLARVNTQHDWSSSPHILAAYLDFEKVFHNAPDAHTTDAAHQNAS